MRVAELGGDARPESATSISTHAVAGAARPRVDLAVRPDRLDGVHQQAEQHLADEIGVGPDAERGTGVGAGARRWTCSRVEVGARRAGARRRRARRPRPAAARAGAGGRRRAASRRRCVRRSISAVMKRHARSPSASPAATVSPRPCAAERITASGIPHLVRDRRAASCPSAASFSLCTRRARAASIASIWLRMIVLCSRSRRRPSMTHPRQEAEQRERAAEHGADEPGSRHARSSRS